MTSTSRQWLLDTGARTGARLFSAHFADTSAGVVRRTREGFAWAFE
jgi:hypothetical protein